MHPHSLALGIALATAGGAAAASEEVVRGLDHIPLAVLDLERSKADFKALGFALKPGRLHANGLRNAHVKFADGTEIELITAPAAVDALTSGYQTWLQGGDGAAFLGLYAPNPNALTRRLSRQGLVLSWKGDLGTFSEPAELRRLFFARRQHSPTDRPEHFAHANTGFSLAGVWLAGAASEQRLLRELGAAPIGDPPCGPFGSVSAAFALFEGEIMFLPAAAQLTPGRSIIGATVTVRRLAAARTILGANGVPYIQVAGCARDSIWVGPKDAHGLWLELHQP